MKRVLLLGAVLVLLGCLRSASGQTAIDAKKLVEALMDDKDELAVDSFKVLPLRVEVSNNNWGLNADKIRTKIELKLRSAGLTPVIPSGSLKHGVEVQISLVGYAFHVDVRFSRLVDSSKRTADKWVGAGLVRRRPWNLREGCELCPWRSR